METKTVKVSETVRTAIKGADKKPVIIEIADADLENVFGAGRCPKAR